MRFLTQTIVRPWFVCGMAMLAGCASIDSRPPEEIVAERALEQVAFLMAGDFDNALSYMSPSYRNGGRAQFYSADKSGALSWQKADLKWVKCEDAPEPKRCEIRLLITVVKPPAIRTPIVVPLDDIWIKVENRWFMYE